MSWTPSADDVTRIWNRAALSPPKGQQRLVRGDRMLADVLSAHSLIKNGGVVHCPEVLSAEEIAAAIEGFRFLGLTDAAAVLNEAASVSLDRLPPDEAERTETRLNESYWRHIPSDRTIAEAFEKELFATPGNFALPT